MADATTEESGESTSSSQTPLNDLFSNEPETEAKASSSNEPEDTEEDDKEESDQKFPVSDSSPDEKKDEKPKDSEKQLPDAKKDSKEKPESKPDDEAAAKKTAEQAAADELKKKWENDENPYFKRFKDTSSSWQKEHQEKLQLQSAVAQMQQEVVTLRKIADGTYDPEVDDPAKHVTPEMIASHSLMAGKALASKTAAEEVHGKDVVEQRLAKFHEVFGNQPMVQQLVMESNSHVAEAFRYLDRLDFETKYGSTPTDIHKNIKAEVEKELRATLKAEITEELMGRADKKNNTPRGLSSSRGSNGIKPGQNSKGKGQTTLKELFS